MEFMLAVLSRWLVAACFPSVTKRAPPAKSGKYDIVERLSRGFPGGPNSARPDRTRPGKVQTISAHLRTFSRHSGHVLDAMFGVNRDIRLETGVGKKGIAACFGRKHCAANHLREISRGGAEAQSGAC
jgi:hypothetical protein